MIEKLAYWNVLLQMPVYVAQKDVSGGLHWDQALKGIIFFVWALFQNIVPIFSGGFTDRYGYKKSFFLAIALIFCGYLLLGTQREIYPFILGTIILGIGSGIFRPTLQASLSLSIPSEKETKAWGIYVMLINVAVMLTPPLSKYLKDISWTTVFFASAGLTFLNLLIVILFKNLPTNKSNSAQKIKEILKNIFRNLFKKDIIWFLICMSGFIIIYMQFYETLPNFIIDWVDTSDLANSLKLPEFMLINSPNGKMISYEWIYNLNSILVILLVVIITSATKNNNRLKTISFGIILASFGLQLCGLSREGYYLIGGVIIYTLGEIIVNPKFLEHLSKKAESVQKALYMGYLNLSYAIGLSIGALSGGYIYKHFGEKAYLASKYLGEYYNIKETNLSQSFEKLRIISNLNSSELTNLLWNNYNPQLIWLPFLVIGLISALGLLILVRQNNTNNL
ncbi:MAG: MFS transporter [Candidatus Kapabacteria bacterium]|nr:MFS transporter [Candidatus Kapabacteria bacterium]